MDPQQTSQGRQNVFLGDAPICICSGSIHNRVTKFYFSGHGTSLERNILI